MFAGLAAVAVAAVLITLFFLLGFSKELPAESPDGGFAASGDAAAFADSLFASGNGSASGGTESALTQGGDPVAVEWTFPILSAVTGTDGDSGVAAAWGLDYGIQQINETGGIRGVFVKSVVKDTSGSATKAEAEMTSLAQNSLVVFGPAGEQEFDAAHRAAAEERIANIGYVASESVIGEFAPFIISCSAEPGKDAQAALTDWFAQNPNVTSLCVLYDPSLPSAADRLGGVRTLLAGADGVSLAGVIEIGNTAFNAASVAETALDTDADAYYIEAGGESFVRLVAQLRNDNVPAEQILGGASAASASLFDYAESSGMSEDIEGVSIWSLSDPAKMQTWQVFEKASETHVDAAQLEIAADYYEAAFLVKLAIEALGITGDPMLVGQERERLATWLYNTDEISSPRGTFRIENGEKVIHPRLLRIENGAFADSKSPA